MDYKVVYEDLNTDRVRGFVAELDPDRYLIVINARLPEAEQCEVLDHELHHIREGHFKTGMTVDQIEKETHRRIRGTI